MNRILGWIGALFGVLGAIILSMNIEQSGYGYPLFLVSSTCLAVWAIREKQHHQLMMQIVFTGINLNGCLNWLA